MQCLKNILTLTSVIDLMDLYTGDKDNEESSGQFLYTLIINFLTPHDISFAKFIGLQQTALLI